MKTIAAISTPQGNGGIAVIRMSGKDAARIAAQFFTASSGMKPHEFNPRKAYFGTAELDGFSDRCVAVYFNAPKSYTGEDIVEISCHGGAFVAESVLSACLKAGAILAAPGEFTRRAFLNGKLTLSSAEGIIDLINSESAAEANAAGRLADGALSREAADIQDKLADFLAEIEAAIDYPDDVDFLQKDNLSAKIATLLEQLKKIIATFSYGKILKNGLSVVIAGRPNAGKSSLMNALLRFDRSIVTPIAGTTRDTVSENLLLRDIKINLTDTAGIREDAAEIEKMGVERSYKAAENADLILYLFDASEGMNSEDKKILNVLKDKKVILLANKCDLKAAKNTIGAIAISALSGTNIDKVADDIYNFAASFSTGSSVTVLNERHRLIIQEVARILIVTLQNLAAATADLIAADLTEVYKKLGEITGTTASEEIINRIFEKFCLGK